MPSPFEAVSGVANACQALPTVVTGGQPTAEQLRALAGSGNAIVLDIRDSMEPRPIPDEPALVNSLGMEYVNVPVSTGTLSDETMENILRVLRGAGDRAVFFHCGSGNRVGGAMIAHLMLDIGLGEDDAVQQAMRMGLRSPEYLQWGLDYAARNSGSAKS